MVWGVLIERKGNLEPIVRIYDCIFLEVCPDAEQMSFMRVLWKFQSRRNQLLQLRASYNYLTPPPPQSSPIIFIGIENSLKKLIVN